MHNPVVFPPTLGSFPRVFFDVNVYKKVHYYGVRIMSKMRGARAATANELVGVMMYDRVSRKATPPTQLARVPATKMWGNDVYGDCVTAEEAFNLSCFSNRISVPDQTVIDWAKANGFLNGAGLIPVMQMMQQNGMVLANSEYYDGCISSVNFNDPEELIAAISEGCVKLGIDADCLPSGAGDADGWFAVNPIRARNIDHCVSLSSYGSSAFLYAKLGIVLPSELTGQENGYLLFTWDTQGFVTQSWIDYAVSEAYLRTPSTETSPYVGKYYPVNLDDTSVENIINWIIDHKGQLIEIGENVLSIIELFQNLKGEKTPNRKFKR